MTPPTLHEKNHEAHFRRLYRALNREQRQAVDAIEGVVMVLAGPGTGKTQVVAMRIANILRQTHMQPDNVLCLTFTESGVAAMRERLLDIVGTAAYYVRIHTFHSFCNEVIQENPEKFSFARELEPLSDIERVELFQELIDALPGASSLKPYGNPYLYVPEAIANIQRLKQERVSVAAFSKIVSAAATFETQVRTALARVSAAPTARELQQFRREMQAQRGIFPRFQAYFTHLDQLYQKYRLQREAARTPRQRLRAVATFFASARRWHGALRTRIPKQRALARVYRAYEATLRRRGRYDYEDMLVFVVERFKRDEVLLARYQEQFQYILVDEYQDTNGAQNETVALLGSFYENPNIFVVGDDKQSIFRFQGASLENLLYFYERYRNLVRVIALRKNYRSPQALLDAAQAVITHNQETIDRYIPHTTQRLAADTSSAHARRKKMRHMPPLTIQEFPTVEAEDYFLATQIARLLEQGSAPAEIAVLCRRNAEVVAIAEQLRLRGISVQAVHEGGLLEVPLVRQLFVLLEYLVDPTRGAHLFTVLHFDFLKLPAVEIVKLQRYAVREKVDLFTALNSRRYLRRAGIDNIASLQHAAALLADWQAAAARETAPVFLSRLLHESHLLAAIEATSLRAEGLSRIEAIFREAESLHRRQGHVSVADFLGHMKLLETHGLRLPLEILPQTSAVQVMTAHKAKGLEFVHVFVARAVDKNWGNIRQRTLLPLPPGILAFDPVWENTRNEDERRLFYVAVTRARTTLHISYAAQTATGRPQLPSIFLAEIPARLASRSTAAAAVISPRLSVPPPVFNNNNRSLRAYLRTLLAHYVLSVTHLNAYLECPRLFYYRHFLRVPYVPNKQLALGTALHGALYDFFSRGTPAKLPSRALLLKSFAARLQREVLTESELKDARARGAVMLREYYEHYRGEFCRRVLLEYSFARQPIRVQGIPITGRIDKIEIIDPVARKVNVVDYKTGNPDTKRAEVRPGGAYHRQLVFYQLLCDTAPRFPYTMESGEIDFLQRSISRGTYVKKKIKVTPRDTTTLLGEMTTVWNDIQRLAFLGTPAVEFCGACEFCQMAS